MRARMKCPPFFLRGRLTRIGKTDWAISLFKNPLTLGIRKLEQFPEKMRSFRRGKHDALVLDDVRDMEFLSSHQEKL